MMMMIFSLVCVLAFFFSSLLKFSFCLDAVTTQDYVLPTPKPEEVPDEVRMKGRKERIYEVTNTSLRNLGLYSTKNQQKKLKVSLLLRFFFISL